MTVTAPLVHATAIPGIDLEAAGLHRGQVHDHAFSHGAAAHGTSSAARHQGDAMFSRPAHQHLQVVEVSGDRHGLRHDPVNARALGKGRAGPQV